MPCAAHGEWNCRQNFSASIEMKSPTSDIRDVNRPSYRKWGKWRQGEQVCRIPILIHRQIFTWAESLPSYLVEFQLRSHPVNETRESRILNVLIRTRKRVTVFQLRCIQRTECVIE